MTLTSICTSLCGSEGRLVMTIIFILAVIGIIFILYLAWKFIPFLDINLVKE